MERKTLLKEFQQFNLTRDEIYNLGGMNDRDLKEYLNYCLMHKKRKTVGYMLIDEGLISGKPAWVYATSLTKKSLLEIAKRNSYPQKNIIALTCSEWEYLAQIPGHIEVGYNSMGKTLTDKFYY